MEQKVNPNIETSTVATATTTNIDIHTFYNENDCDCSGVLFTSPLPNTLQALIGNNVGSIDSTGFIENELLMTMKNYPKDIDHWIDDDGNLITYGEDNGSYSIDEYGYLMYDLCVGLDFNTETGQIITDTGDILVDDLGNTIDFTITSISTVITGIILNENNEELITDLNEDIIYNL